MQPIFVDLAGFVNPRFIDLALATEQIKRRSLWPAPRLQRIAASPPATRTSVLLRLRGAQIGGVFMQRAYSCKPLCFLKALRMRRSSAL